MTVVAFAVAVLLAAGFGLALIRIVRGPSTLDRIVANDVLLAITVGAIATEAAYTRDATGLPILLGLALLGPIASIAVGRFVDPAAPVVGAVPRHPEGPEDPPPGPAGQR
ncbi:monovalent cation/H+ antiporter complex subunit F [Plantactinospora sp. BB1]|uniref:monovalent cation/H+ antiporter complex subunit F n=1 Tax=Plantactinospora sp. BB1 TaxID=2071627 RepID=UPI000D16B1BC|nr:cation:proton antiporter [Plantactinospora sp. BB1]